MSRRAPAVSSPTRRGSSTARFKREGPKKFQGLPPESQDQNLALTGMCAICARQREGEEGWGCVEEGWGCVEEGWGCVEEGCGCVEEGAET